MTSPTPSHSSIDEFWRTFRRIEGALRRDLDDPKQLAALDRAVQAIGPIAWEVGPGVTKPFGVSLSPGGDVRLLPITRAVVARAPDSEHWEIHAALPPKAWDGTLTTDDSSEHRVEVSTATWRYILFDYSDGRYDLDLVAPDLADVPREKQTSVAEIAVVSWAGEEAVLEHLGEIRLVETFPDGREGVALPSLGRHLESLAARTRR